MNRVPVVLGFFVFYFLAASFGMNNALLRCVHDSMFKKITMQIICAYLGKI